MLREQVIEAIIKRIRRDGGYLAYRKASGRHTSYDELVKADLQALALAACWLTEPDSPMSSTHSSRSSCTSSS